MISPNDHNLAGAAPGSGPVASGVDLLAGGREMRLRHLIDGLFTFVGLCTLDGVLIEANRALLDVDGVADDDVIGKPFWDTYLWSWDVNVQRRLKEAVVRGVAGETSRYDVEVRVRDGRRITIDFQLVPLVEDGAVWALVVSGLDVTDRRQRVRQLSSLASLARQLSAAATTREVARAIAQMGVGVLDAKFASVALIDPLNPNLVRVVQPDTLPQGLAEAYAHIPLSRHLPSSDSIRTAGPVFLVDRDQAMAEYPELVADRDAAGVVGTAAVPLLRSNGAVFGSLAVGWGDAVEFTDELQSLLATVADLCAQSLERSRLADAQSELARTMQAQLLPTVPTVAGLDIAVGYLPATTALGFGGDWYDVVELEDHLTAIVVGDIVGHGIPAASRVAKIRGVVNTLIRMRIPLDELFTRASEMVAHLGELFLATVAVSIVDTRAGTVSCLLAGHPPPALQLADRSVTLLRGVLHPPLGMPTPPAPVPTFAFPEGASLVVYTDGLVERRDERIDRSIADLVARLRARPVDTARALNDELLATAGDRGLTDDVAVVVVRRLAST